MGEVGVPLRKSIIGDEVIRDWRRVVSAVLVALSVALLLSGDCCSDVVAADGDDSVVTTAEEALANLAND